MDTKRAFIIALVLDVVFLAMAGYFYTDAKAQNELSATLAEEKAAMDAKLANIQKENASLKNRLQLFSTEGSGNKNV